MIYSTAIGQKYLKIETFEIGLNLPEFPENKHHCIYLHFEQTDK